MANGRERRQFVRIDGTHLVRHEKFRLPRGSKVYEDRTSNISAGGVLFETTAHYELGTVLRLELLILGIDRHKTGFYKADKLSQTDPFVVLGKVVRVEMVRDGVYDIGINLVGLDYADRKTLARYITASQKSVAQPFVGA